MPFVTSADVEVLHGQVKAQWRALDLALAGCVQTGQLTRDDPLVKEWGFFVDAVSKYLQDAPSFLGLRAASQMNTGQQIQRDLAKWTEKIAALGCNVPPAPQPPGPGILDSVARAVDKGATALEASQNLGGIATLALLWLLVSALKK
jgi:hypothetical protein